MTKTYILKPRKKDPVQDPLLETYMAPPPPTDGRTVGLDCHPDTFTAALFKGSSLHDARKVGTQVDLSMEGLLEWAADNLTGKDVVVMEAGSNSFEVAKRLRALGLRAYVLESAHVGKHAKTYADNDKMAAARIAMVYMGTKAPCVWIPDEKSRERRELLHAYLCAVEEHTAAGNSLKGFLNGHGIRLGKRNPEQDATARWVEAQRSWSGVQGTILREHFARLAAAKERRQRFRKMMAVDMAGDAQMMGTMKLLGISLVNAFALLAVIGDINRFDNPKKLVAYVGLNPGLIQSGRNKNIRIGVGKRGRSDIRHLLIQGAHSVLVKGSQTPLGKWGWKLFARKGHRNVAVAAVARKMLVQVWHLLKGNPPELLENDKSFTLKLHKLAVVIGSEMRKQIGLDGNLTQAVETLLQRCNPQAV